MRGLELRSSSPEPRDNRPAGPGLHVTKPSQRSAIHAQTARRSARRFGKITCRNAQPAEEGRQVTWVRPRKRRIPFGPQALAVATVLAVAFVPAPVQARTGELVIRGSGPASVEFSFDRDAHVPLQGWSASGDAAGGYVGFFLQALSPGGRSIGSLRVDAHETADLPEYDLPLTDLERDDRDPNTVRAPAGRYRAYLLSAGEAEVRLPVRELTRTLDLKTTRPARVQAGPIRLTGAGADQAYAGVGERPLTLTQDSVSVVAVHVLSSGQATPALSASGVCLEPRSVALHTCDEAGVQYSNQEVAIGPTGHITQVTDLVKFYPHGARTQGQHMASVEALDTVPVRQAVGFALTLGLTPRPHATRHRPA